MSETVFRVEEHGFGGGMLDTGWSWRLVTHRDTYEGAVAVATAYAGHMDAAGIRPYGMRVVSPEGTVVWDDLETLEERRRMQDEGRRITGERA